VVIQSVTKLPGSLIDLLEMNNKVVLRTRKSKLNELKRLLLLFDPCVVHEGEYLFVSMRRVCFVYFTLFWFHCAKNFSEIVLNSSVVSKQFRKPSGLEEFYDFHVVV